MCELKFSYAIMAVNCWCYWKDERLRFCKVENSKDDNQTKTISQWLRMLQKQLIEYPENDSVLDVY